jgi:hypothetical protein
VHLCICLLLSLSRHKIHCVLINSVTHFCALSNLDLGFELGFDLDEEEEDVENVDE